MGFTLVEMMAVLVIAAVLLMFALPPYTEHVIKTRRAMARAELLKVAIRQEQFFVDQHRYAENLKDLGYPASVYGFDTQGHARSGSAEKNIYLIGLATVAGAYTLNASPLLGDDRCGVLSLDSRGGKGATGPGGITDCW